MLVDYISKVSINYQQRHTDLQSIEVLSRTSQLQAILEYRMTILTLIKGVLPEV